MSPVSASAPDRRVGASSPYVVLHALDLTRPVDGRIVWSPAEIGGPTEMSTRGLPDPGVMSPMGFWFSGTGVAGGGTDARTVRVFEPSRSGDARVAGNERSGGAGRFSRHVVVDVGGSVVSLTIGPEAARVATSRTAWESMEEALLLAFGQWWRFYDVDEALGQLLRQTRRDQRHASMPSLRTLLEGRRLARVDSQIRALLADYAQFADVLYDAGRHCTTPEAAEAYGALSAGLDLDGWSERIDERAAIVATTYEVIVDKLMHYKLFVWGIALEVLIVVLIGLTLLR